jgi:hypothetical protein
LKIKPIYFCYNKKRTLLLVDLLHDDDDDENNIMKMKNRIKRLKLNIYKTLKIEKQKDLM